MRVKAQRSRATAGSSRGDGVGFAQDQQASSVKVMTDAVDIAEALTAAGRYEDAADLVLQKWSQEVRQGRGDSGIGTTFRCHDTLALRGGSLGDAVANHYVTVYTYEL